MRHASFRNVFGKKELVLFYSGVDISTLQFYHGSFTLRYDCKNDGGSIYIHLKNITDFINYIKKSKIYIDYYYPIGESECILLEKKHIFELSNIPKLLIRTLNDLEEVEYI